MSLRDVVQWDKPLPEVEPAIYRRALLLFMSPAVLLVSIVFGMLAGLIDMLEAFWRVCVECWRG